MWVELLLLKTEALYLVEVLARLKWDYVVCTNACHWLVCGIEGCVEC